MRWIFLALLLVGCSDKQQWSLFYYPDRENVPSALEAGSHIKGRFSTFEDCQMAAVAIIRQTMDNASYECGLNCYHDPELGVARCEESRR